MNTLDTLSEKDLEVFYRLRNSLYMFVNYKLNILPKISNWKEVGNYEPEKVVKIRNHIFIKNIDEIDNFVNLNPYNFSKEELNILCSWKNKINADKFVLVKYEKEHTLFLGKEKVYAIKGLLDSFKDMFEEYSPILVDLIILPFKDFLVHEGHFRTYNITMGRSMASGMKAEAEETIIKKGVITNLNKDQQKEVSDADLLRFYMKSETNRDRFFEKIDELKGKTEELRQIYNCEMGRVNLRHIKSQLKKQKIKGYFAILFSQIVASGSTKKELEDNISKILPKEKLQETYRFSIK